MSCGNNIMLLQTYIPQRAGECRDNKLVEIDTASAFTDIKGLRRKKL